MKYLVTLLTLFVFLITFAPLPSTLAQANIETLIRKRMEEFMTLRQAGKGNELRKYYDVEKIKEVHEYIKFQYISIKEDLKKGVFTEKHIRRVIEDSSFGDPYKEALLKCVFKNGDFDKELDLALTSYLGKYDYKLTKFVVDQVAVQADGKSVRVGVIETRLGIGQKNPQEIPRIYKWELKNNVWLLSLENRPNM